MTFIFCLRDGGSLFIVPAEVGREFRTPREREDESGAFIARVVAIRDDEEALRAYEAQQRAVARFPWAQWPGETKKSAACSTAYKAHRDACSAARDEFFAFQRAFLTPK